MSRFIAIVAVTLIAFAGASALAGEKVHQTVNGDKLHAGDGASAVAKGQMETKKVDGAQGGEVARLKGDMAQWGYVTAWFGIPAPEGKSIVRIRIYNDGEKTAKYFLYAKSAEGQMQLGELKLPTDAKPNSFVTVDVPVDSKSEWNGLTIKKGEKSNLPSPWFDTVSVVLPQ